MAIAKAILKACFKAIYLYIYIYIYIYMPHGYGNCLVGVGAEQWWLTTIAAYI